MTLVIDTRVCLHCKAVFEPKRPSQLYCTSSCRKSLHKERFQVDSVSRRLNLPTPTVGALSELRAATDLMMRGYHVFRALSPSCPCDLVAMHNGACLMIEVRTAYQREPDGHVFAPRARRINGVVLALVTPDAIIYEPPIPEIGTEQGVSEP